MRVISHYRDEKAISYFDTLEARNAGVNVIELCERQAKREIIEKLLDEMEYGKPCCVRIDKSVVTNGLSTVLSIDLQIEEL